MCVAGYFAHMHKPPNSIVLVHAMELPTLPSRDGKKDQIIIICLIC